MSSEGLRGNEVPRSPESPQTGKKGQNLPVVLGSLEFPLPLLGQMACRELSLDPMQKPRSSGGLGQLERPFPRSL